MSEKGVKDVKHVLRCLVLSTTQRRSVHCHKGVKKPEVIHILEAGIRELVIEKLIRKMKIQLSSSRPRAAGKVRLSFLVHKTFLERRSSVAVSSKTADKSKNNNN